MNDQPLMDAGDIRLYANRVEMDSGFIFRKTNVYYYSDFYSINISGRWLTIKKSAMKNAVMLQFRNKKQAQEALSIINAHKV
ncbi:hypothetical protein [Bifidobacterium aerophilum]|uniref:DUF304 domain-containing protein n=1 Tax=Bifidobacterium aerophilum TaxID=1798155 RepID=A0A6N9Z569_9BIFI|nr:hypothetical protein [Bifidobacterium aerophilum]NEG89641.1 hypothetical protein [Bifidobacterium aerophilum]